MATLSITKSYAAGSVLTASNLNDIKSSIETFVNTTQIDYDNISIESTLNNLSQSQAETILSAGGYGTLVTTTLGSDQALTATATNYNTVSNVSAGVYLLSAVALVTFDIDSTTLSGDRNILNINVYNVTDSVAICPESVAGASLLVGLTTLFSSTTLTKKQVVSWVYPVTLTATSSIAFRASISDATLGSGTLHQNSVIQLYRLRSS